eukprot:GHVP01066411.1.p1 GENE.GHVP01066411.1~~GHVP01066411.1.p1  ORF type:complete len:524 (+),score=118.36 GHVP01066411.1:24-1595(+)
MKIAKGRGKPKESKTSILSKRRAIKLEKVYCQRNKAYDQTGLQKQDFEKICIWKGIHARIPPHKGNSSSRIYYHANDLKSIRKDPTAGALMTIKAYLKKCRKAMGRGEKFKGREMYKNAPQTDLSHTVQERYPTFLHAVRDLDDALSTAAMFAVLPMKLGDRICAGPIRDSKCLMNDFHCFVAQSRSLRKIFASIKGYYLEAEILGEYVLWLVPHQFTQTIPIEADFDVMCNYLEFYRTLLRFANFKLFSLANLAFPYDKNDGTIRSFMLSHSLEKKQNGFEEEPKEQLEDVPMEDDQAPTTPAPKILVTKPSAQSTLFTGISFFVSREVPRIPVCLALAACGAQNVVFDDPEAGELGEEITKLISFHIVDRPVKHLKKIMQQFSHRQFVQPQWVFDCVNGGLILPATPYAPGVVPPPHFSPFVEGRLEKIRESAAAQETYDSDDEGAEAVDEKYKEMSKEIIDEKGEEVPEVEAEKSQKKTRKELKKDEDERMRKRSLLTSKQRKMYDRVRAKEEKENEKKI